jgi:CRP-like cAMP-binding protein
MPQLAHKTQIISFPGQAHNFVPANNQQISLAELRENNLLASVPVSALMEIAPQIQKIRVVGEDIIFDEDDRGDLAYLILEGSVRISKRGRGGQQETLSFLQPGDYFGEMALIALRSSQCCRWSHPRRPGSRHLETPPPTRSPATHE